MGKEEEKLARLRDLGAYKVDARAHGARRSPTRSSSTACPPTAATRSTPRSSTARRASSGTRRRTACTPRRRCWCGCCGRAERAGPAPLEAAARPATRWERLNGPQRIAGVDLARGLAVLGMFAAHLLWIDDFDFADPSTWVGRRRRPLLDPLRRRSRASRSASSPGGRRRSPVDALRTARLRLVVRAVPALALGILLIATGVPVYVILPAYAILFLLALPLPRLLVRARCSSSPARSRWSCRSCRCCSRRCRSGRARRGSDLARHSAGTTRSRSGSRSSSPGLGVARAGILRIRVQLWMVGSRRSALAVAGYGLDALTRRRRAAAEHRSWGAVWTARPALERPAGGDRLGRVRARGDRRSACWRAARCSRGSCFPFEPSERCRSPRTPRSSWCGRCRGGGARRHRRPARLPRPRAVLAAEICIDHRVHRVGAADRPRAAGVG